MNKDVMGVQEVSPGYEFVAENPAVPMGYKQTEVGVIPEDWHVSTVGNYIGFEGGSQPDKSFFSAMKKPGYCRLIQIRDYKSDNFEVFIPRNMARRFCSQADIMIGRYGPPVFQILRGLEGAYNVALIKATPKEGIDQEFAYYFLSQDTLFHFIDKLSRRTSGQTGVDLKELKAYPFPLPECIEEQRAIATALSDVDALLEELDRLIAKKRDIKQATMQQLLSGETRLPGFEEEWDSRSLLQIADNQKALFDDGDWVEAEHITDQGIRLVQTGNIGEGVFVDKATKKYIYDASFEKLRCKELKEGDILICRLAEPAGRACIFPDISESRAITSVDVTIFRPRSEVADRQYLVQYFSTSDWFKMVLDHVGGTTHKRISRGALGKLKVPFPSIEEQRAIAEILSDMDAKIQALEQRRSKTAELKQGMMQELLTGRTRLV